MTMTLDPPRSGSSEKRREPSAKRRERDSFTYYVFLVPFTVLWVGFTVWPMLSTWVFSMFSWDGTGFPGSSDFIGLDNYREAMADPVFWRSVLNTLGLAIGAVIVEVPLALVLAVLLNNQRLRGRNAYRLVFFLPVVTTTAVAAIAFNMLLDPTSGFIDSSLRASHAISSPIEFLGSPQMALPTVLGVMVWKELGLALIYWLAALQTVPAELMEAAKVDGANFYQQLRHVLVPAMAPMAFLIILLTFMNSLQMFDLVQVLTGGGPNHATDIVETYIFHYAFNPESSTPRYGYASAAGVLFGVVVLLFSVTQLLLVRRARSRSGSYQEAR